MVGRNDYEAEKEAREKRLMAYTEENPGKFFADHKRVGRGAAPSKANAARGGGYDWAITIESGEI